MVKTLGKRLLPIFLAIILVVATIPMGIFTASATTVTVLDGKVSLTDTLNNIKASGDSATATAKGGKGILAAREINTITITNKSDVTATLSFDYTASNSPNSFSIDNDSTVAQSGTYSKVLSNGDSFTISIEGKNAAWSNTATLTLSNFSFVAAATSSNVTFEFDNNYGSITVDGATINTGDVKGIGATNGAALVATATNGATFKGWVDGATGAILSTSASYTVKPAGDMTVKAVFIGANSKPHFMLGALVKKEYATLESLTYRPEYWTIPSGTYIFDDLNDAASASAKTQNKGIVLMNSSTLPAGTYTIPSGSVLLIPFDSNNTLYKSEAFGREFKTDLDGNGSEEDATSERNRHSISYYRTLTMSSGANIILNGEMSLSAKHLWTQGATTGGGSPVEAVSRVIMEDGSSITVNNGGVLYAYGFITGSGNVTAKNGSKVYEYFQITDFRGGSQSTDMKNGVFPISQYYVQNIEVSLKLEYGAKEYSYTTIHMNRLPIDSSVPFIGPSDCMFNLTSGYVVKRYDGTTDRTYIDLNGDMKVSPITIPMGTSSINSEDYELPVNNNFTINVNSGSNITMGQDIALLPGSEIIISEGAKCILGTNVSIYIYDLDQWGNYTGATNKKFIPVVNAPGRTYTRTEADLKDAEIQVNGEIDASNGFAYTTAGGANVYSTGAGTVKLGAPGTQTVTHQIIQAAEPANSRYPEIPITPVKLKNADGSYLNSAKDTYTYVVDKWVCTNHNYNAVVTEPTCSTEGFTTHTCTACGESYKDNTVVPKEHPYNEVVTPPTCDAQGYTTYTCPDCGDAYVGNYVGALDHNYNAVVTPPTCAAKGYTTYTCACGDSYVSDYVDALPHSYNTAVTPPTCAEKGYTTYTCSVCGDNYIDDYVDTIPHSYGDWIITNNATCDIDGERYRVCSCGDIETEVIKAKGHSYSNDYTIDQEPTDLTEGTKSRHCANCESVTDENAVPALTGFVVTLSGNNATVTGYRYKASGRLSIPETLDGYNVVAIAQGAFAGQSGISIIEIPFGVTSIADAFEGCDNLLALNYFGTIADWKNVEKVIPEGIRINYLGENIGDLNGDEDVNADDMTYIITYILKGGELNEVETYVYDINADNKINLLDLVRLKRYLADDWAYLGHETAVTIEERIETFMASPKSEALSTVSVIANEEYTINDYETFIMYSSFLEELAYAYMLEMDPSADPMDLYIKYIRTGVDRYNTGSWGIMAGYENKDFAQFVQEIQDSSNEGLDPSECVYLTALKNINNFYLPNGEYVDFGHMFGTMDMTYHNKGSINHADVGGWAGDLVDLLTAADEGKVTGTIEEMVAEISANYLNKEVGENGKFSQTDMYGDLDGMYLMKELDAENYFYGDFTALMMEYFTEDLSMEDRAAYFIESRMNGVALRSTLRTEVYNTYIGNMVITTLEATREFTSSNLENLRKACCYAFADYICKLAGDYVDSVDNKYFEPFSTNSSILAPGVTQEIKYATTADDKQMIYYIATADLTRDDVNLYANYNNNDPSLGWAMQPVLDQANAAQNKYGNPDSEQYIENYNVIVATNGSGFNMATGEPSGVLVMGGVEHHPIGSNGFVGVLKDGTPVIGTTEEYNTIYKGKVQEAIEIFGATLVKDGKIVVKETANHTDGRASRTAIGITKTGKVVMMVLDGRQEPVSCGGSMLEIAQIMLDAGCVQAVNLDGGGSTTFVSKAEGADELAVVNRPSDGYARSVSTSFMIVSTAPSSTAFDHAVIKSDYDYLTAGSSINVTAAGVSATGNAAELPEGTSWSVSDASIATIDQNGVLTAKANGSVNVYLMLNGEAIAVKSIGVVVPDNVYFTKKTLNAVYGARVELPLKLTYMAKPVMHNANDVIFSMNNKAAGSFDGLVFIGNESGNVKNVTITVTLKTNTDALASMTISLFSQGEAVFDFEQATGGDKEMAWDRIVSNSTTDDALSYYVLNPNSDMVTSYTFAIDMSKIGIPEQLGDLVYMLPGAGTENASAWGFLCQLAERVSALTEVKATIKFDANVIVDYSKLTIVSDYFIHTATEFDEVTNTVVVTLKWIDQTEPIDTTMANPICIVSGIKLTPKSDADWGADGKLQLVNSGNITYDIYLRASALYTFALKEENQQAFNLYPFVNPDNESEKGGHYSAVYKAFEDKYTLVSALKNGWANEDGGFVYYVDGERLTGINLIDGYYYDFGENGVNPAKTTYTGLFFDKTVSKYRYAKLGELQSGWQMIGDDWYRFGSDKNAATGKTVVGGIHFEFYEDGRLVSGVWVNTLQGKRYYYGPTYYYDHWRLIDGKEYFFKKGIPVTGYQHLSGLENTAGHRWCYFDEDGVFQGLVNGIIEVDGIYYYIENGLGIEKYLFEYEGNYYFARYGGKLITNETFNAWATSCDLPKGTYTFGPDGKMLGTNPNGEILEFNGKLYYYENGKGVEKGLFKFEGDYYFIKYRGEIVTNQTLGTYSISGCDLPNGVYEFGADGKMLQGIVEKDGGLYYYENGKPVEKGLFKIGNDYYFAKYKGELVRNQVFGTYLTNCDLPNGRYEFGADGKMLKGIVEKDGVLYYYENGKGVEKGLFKFDGDYYFSRYHGKLVTNQTLGTYSLCGCDLPNGRYEFGADGKMLQGIVEKNGVLYYYENGKTVEKGLFKFEGNYYFAKYNGKLVTNQVCGTYSYSDCDLPNGRYEFGADGKMLQGIVEKDGVLYYYENGKTVEKGLFKLGDDYYFAQYRGVIVTNQVFGTYLSNCDLPNGKYEFGADGKMLQGIVDKGGVLVYYENGKAKEKGLFKLGDDYYFARYNGALAINQTCGTYSLSDCDLPNGRYEFGADGKMLQGIVEKNGVLYYYENGKGVEKGLFLYEGHYYCAEYAGKLVVNTQYYVWNTNALLIGATYTFNALGQIVA